MRARVARQAVIVASALALGHSGCSVLFVTGPPRPRPAHFSCTRSKVAPILDVAFATAFALKTFICLSETDVFSINGYVERRSEWCHPNTTNSALDAGLAVALGASATFGFIRVGQCREALFASEGAP